MTNYIPVIINIEIYIEILCYLKHKIWVAIAALPKEWGRPSENQKMPCDLSAIALFVTFPTLVVSIIHLILTHTVGAVACRVLSHTLRVVWAGSAHEGTQKERGKLLCGQQGRAVLGSPARCPLGCLSCAAVVRMKRKMMIFLACFPTIYYMLFFSMGSTQTPSWMLIFVARLQLSTVIRETVAHWPLTSCARVIG